MSPTKIRYEIDPFNRLIIPGFRQIIDGEFKIDKNNALSYVLKAPRSSSTPQQLKLIGSWSLDKNHNLVLTLNKENNQLAGKKITLQGEVIRAKADKIEFLISSKDKNGQAHLYILGLSGTWQADKNNRLKFLVQRKNDTQDELTLSGTWEVDRRNQIVYTYTKTNLKRKVKVKQSLTFKGYWNITDKQRLTYVLNEETGSGFDFKVSFGEPLGRGLRYELGIGANPKKKKIMLFGAWKLNKKIGLVFEMPCEGNRINSISFGATCKLDKDKQLELNLKDSQKNDLGIKLKFSRAFLDNQGEAFIQTLKQGKEIVFSLGAGFRW